MSSGRLSAFLYNPFLRPPAERRSERDSWPEATATVADCFNLAGVLDKGWHSASLYSIRFIYWVDGRMYTGCFKSPTGYAAGDSLQVRHDPRHPERNSFDPEELLRTELLLVAAAALVALYVAMAWHI